MKPTYGKRLNYTLPQTRTGEHKNTQAPRRHGYYPNRANWRTKFQWHIQGHFEFFAVFQNVHLFIPRFFTEVLIMLCGTLDDKHSRWMKPRRRVSGCKLDGNFKVRVSRNKQFHRCFCIQNQMRQRDNTGWVYWRCWIWKKAFYEWCGHATQTDHLCHV
jgi:hypothetical protein